jgi:hypothetical protein
MSNVRWATIFVHRRDAGFMLRSRSRHLTLSLSGAWLLLACKSSTEPSPGGARLRVLNAGELRSREFVSFVLSAPSDRRITVTPRCGAAVFGALESRAPDGWVRGVLPGCDALQPGGSVTIAPGDSALGLAVAEVAGETRLVVTLADGVLHSAPFVVRP